MFSHVVLDVLGKDAAPGVVEEGLDILLRQT